MYKIRILAQIGLQFTADLFKNDTYIGGLGNDVNGVYINLKEKLNVKEMMVLMSYIPTLNYDFGNKPIMINYHFE